MSDNDEDDEVKNVLRQQPQRGFEGAKDAQKSRQKPVEFERKNLEEDSAFGQGGLQDINSLKPAAKRPRLE